MKKILWVLAVSFLASASALAAGSWQTGKHDVPGAGMRGYKVWLPDGYSSDKPLPMVVALHGCQQSAEDFNTQTGLNALADAKKVIVLYPLQSVALNSMLCWNWMLMSNLSRKGGEPEIIAGIVDQAAKTYAVDKSRIYVTGLSAGGAMTSIMMACYPDVFAAGGVHGGMMYRAANDPATGIDAMNNVSKNNSPEETGKIARQCSEKFSKAVPLMIWHGTGDSIVAPGNVDYIVRQFIKINDLADDGEENNSISLKDPEVKVIKTDKRRNYTQTTYKGFDQDLVVKCMVEGMDHAWSGGNKDIPYSDPTGPNASEIMLDWFLTKSR